MNAWKQSRYKLVIVVALETRRDFNGGEERRDIYYSRASRDKETSDHVNSKVSMQNQINFP